MSDALDQERPVASARELFLVLAGMLSLAFGYYQFWHLPRSQELASLRTQLFESKKKLESDLAVINSLNQVSQADQVIEKADQKLEQVREMNSNFANIVRELSGGDTPDLFQIRNLAVKSEDRFADYSRVLFNMEIEAPFLSVGQFLERLEKSDLLTEVIQIDITRLEKEMKRCTIKLALYSYVARQ